MADIDELSSDSDDEEYVPEGGALSSGDSDASEGEPEEGVAVLGKRRSQRQVKKGDNAQQQKRQRRVQRSVRQNSDEKESCGDVIRESSEAGEGSEASKEEKAKSRIDDLWASFKRDTGLKSQKTLSPASKQTVAVVASGTTTSDDVKAAQGKGIAETDSSKDARSEKTIKVKQKYDFAGEEVEVEKEVAADSQEAKAYLQTQQQQVSEKTPPASLASSSPTTATGGPPSRPKAEAATTKGVLAGSKRSSGLSAVLQSIGKKPKLSTLEKSHLDWQKYKEKEGLEDELAQHSKDGYLDKQAFLQRADVRQFELEREERLKRFRRIC